MPLQTNNDHSESAILSRVLQSDDGQMTAEQARYLLTLEFPQRDLAEMNELARRAREGQLSAADEKSLESYQKVGYLLAQLKAKARIALLKIAA